MFCMIKIPDITVTVSDVATGLPAPHLHSAQFNTLVPCQPVLWQTLFPLVTSTRTALTHFFLIFLQPKLNLSGFLALKRQMEEGVFFQGLNGKMEQREFSSSYVNVGKTNISATLCSYSRTPKSTCRNIHLTGFLKSNFITFIPLPARDVDCHVFHRWSSQAIYSIQGL